MSTEEISKKIEKIPAGAKGANWGFAFLQCFQGKDSKLPKSTFDRVQQGSSNFADDKANEILWKKQIYFRWVKDGVRSALTDAKASALLRRPANKPTFIVIASPDEIAAHDLDQGEDLVIARDELPSYAYFFLPFAGKKKITVTSESLEVDVKATRRMAVLFDEIRKSNAGFDTHDLNVFLARLLFCFFAEDTGIFKSKSLFTNSVASHTADDGSDVSTYLSTLFRRFATEDAKGFQEEHRKFEYVNGGLFENTHPVPVFTKKSRKLLLENGSMDWKAINPDIFGSMFQAIIDPEKRHELGMHYTSRENIMKVICPLFLDDLQEEFRKAKGTKKKLEALHQRIAEIRIFDPACGSGNFLILAYEKLRELEMDIIAEKNEVAELFPRIQINRFHGIEIDDFAHELAMLALWIKEHQMNLVFHERFRTRPAALPLREGAHIVRENAITHDWNVVCPPTFLERGGSVRQHEIYVLGNPPYLGSRKQGSAVKRDIKRLCGDMKSFKSLDLISCWFIKATDYLREGSMACAFVTTNSVCQGDHVSLLWRPLFDGGLRFKFAYESFRWSNEAAGNAGVTCIIVGFSKNSASAVDVYGEKETLTYNRINAYLRPLDDLWLFRRSDSVSKLPQIVFGNMPNDGGNLILDFESKEYLLSQKGFDEKWLREFIGADEFLNKDKRWCLWISDSDVKMARKVPEVDKRLKAVSIGRAKSTEASTRSIAEQPNRFYFTSHQDTDSIIFPSTTSERREYIPLGFFDQNTVISNAGQAIYDAQPWIFGVLSSKMHMEWTRLVAGRLETRVRYSSFVYNNFPIPPIPKATKGVLEEAVFKIIEIREEFHEMTYAEMYDPGKMPPKLLKAHRELDTIVDQCYREKPFTNEKERLKHLIALYKKMTERK